MYFGLEPLNRLCFKVTALQPSWGLKASLSVIRTSIWNLENAFLSARTVRDGAKRHHSSFLKPCSKRRQVDFENCNNRRLRLLCTKHQNGGAHERIGDWGVDALSMACSVGHASAASTPSMRTGIRPNKTNWVVQTSDEKLVPIGCLERVSDRCVYRVLKSGRSMSASRRPKIAAPSSAAVLVAAQQRMRRTPVLL